VIINVPSATLPLLVLNMSHGICVLVSTYSCSFDPLGAFGALPDWREWSRFVADSRSFLFHLFLNQNPSKTALISQY
jgi:hypothetical protein